MGCKFATRQASPSSKPIILPDGSDKGIIPLTCAELFVRLEHKMAADPHLRFSVEVSYIEVCSRNPCFSLLNISHNAMVAHRYITRKSATF
jgi:hypothetical protein